MTLRFQPHAVDPNAMKRTGWEKFETNAGLGATFAIPVGSLAQGGGWDKNLRLGGKLMTGVAGAGAYAALAPAATAKNARIARNYVANARDYDAQAGAYGMHSQAKTSARTKISGLSRRTAEPFDWFMAAGPTPTHMPDALYFQRQGLTSQVKLSAQVPPPGGPPGGGGGPPGGGGGGKPPGPSGAGPNNAGGRPPRQWTWLDSLLSSEKVQRTLDESGRVKEMKVVQEALPLRSAVRTMGLLAAVPAAALATNALYRNSVKRKRANQEEDYFNAAVEVLDNDPHFLQGNAALLQRELGDDFTRVARRGFSTVNKYAPTIASDPVLAAEYMTRLMPDAGSGGMTGTEFLARVEALAKMENSIQKNEPTLASPLGSLFSSLM